MSIKENDAVKNLLLILLSDEPLPSDCFSGEADAPRFFRALQAVKDAVGKEEVPPALYVAAGTKIAAAYLREHAEEARSGMLRVLFALSLPEDGICLEYQHFLRVLRTETALLEGCTGAVLVDGNGPLYTKSTAAQLVSAANGAGCAFIGRPLAEATGDLSNYLVLAAQQASSLEEAYLTEIQNLTGRLIHTRLLPAKGTPKLLALHASSHETSNTYALWKAAEAHLNGIETKEIGLRNGTLTDCSGCPFELCLHYGEQDSCFYGGVMVEDVYPALRETDALLMICPNYNDALGANLTAFINRLTAMYRKAPFADKALFAIIVSGYSGSDLLAAQLIAAMNMNKSFYLPPRFCLTATAHAPGSAMALPGIGERTLRFAENITATLCG